MICNIYLSSRIVKFSLFLITVLVCFVIFAACLVNKDVYIRPSEFISFCRDNVGALNIKSWVYVHRLLNIDYHVQRINITLHVQKLL